MRPTIYDMTHACDVIRCYDGITEALQARMGTGGNQVPLIVVDTKGVAVTENIFTRRIGVISIAENIIGRKEENGDNGVGAQEDISYALNATGVHSVAYSIDSLSSNSMKSSNPNSGFHETGTSKALDTSRLNPQCNQGGVAVANSLTVRRLTPVECERLQGFPDNWTRIPWRKKPEENCPDAPRYKAIGNSWAVPCVRWIAERIDKQLKGKL